MPSSASTSPTVQFEIVHSTEYEYSESVLLSQHVAHLTPRETPYQQCLNHDLRVDPAADVRSSHTDHFGNETTYFAMQAPHKRLSVCARSRVVITPAARPALADTRPWEEATDRAALPLDALECTFEPARGHRSAEMADYARASFGPGRSLVDAVTEFTGRIHEDFTFDPRATTVATPLTQVFKTRRGVCQDFARVEVACLRAIGLPARYVSGYLETVAAPGRPRLVGADASHAWVAVYDRSSGWVDVDPTNNVFPVDTHITLAWGGDFIDVSPIRGVILGGGPHSLKVSVDVLRLPTGS